MTDGPRDEDPDVRFSYANERTFLAWNRTSLALVTAGLAITQLLPPFDVPGGRRLIGLPLIAVIIGLALIASAAGSWEERGRRRNVASGVGAIDPRVVR